MNNRKLVLLILLPVLFSLNSYGQKWDLKLDKDGLTVYTRTIAGSSIQEFRGEIVVKSNMGGVLALIDSIPEYTKWMNDISHAERIKRLSRSTGYIYTIIDSPWPVTDRDLITYYIVKQDTASKTITIDLKNVKEYLPVKNGIVRVPDMDGFWQLVPLSKGVTKVIYQVHFDPGGVVPAAVVNAFITDTPRINLVNLKNIVESPRYPKKVIEYIKEL
jgi:hypothetical protein